MNTLYLDCTSGISGDMTVASLLGLGINREEFTKTMNSIPAHGFRTEISTKVKGGISCTDFNVVLEQDNHDHDMDYLFGHEHGHSHSHGGHEHHHTHSEEKHEEHSHHHHHEHRNLSDVLAIIDGTSMTDGAKKIARKIFGIIAEAESLAHNTEPEKVHFHEVGALDSIADIIAAAYCLDSLGISKVILGKLSEGQGTVRCQHGILPIPVPATLNILQKHSIPFSVSRIHGELITPTGAAIIAALKDMFPFETELPDSFLVRATGYGAGKREYEIPSILRAMLIEESSCKKTETEDSIVKLEANIDDSTGEQLSYAMERLFELGALDVSYIPCTMKKSRPAHILTVICREEDRKALEHEIFAETSTIGIRRSSMNRTKLSRRTVKVSVDTGNSTEEIEVKISEGPGIKKVSPEADSVAAAARNSGKTFEAVYSAAVREASTL